MSIKFGTHAPQREQLKFIGVSWLKDDDFIKVKETAVKLAEDNNTKVTINICIKGSFLLADVIGDNLLLAESFTSVMGYDLEVFYYKPLNM